MQHTARMNGMGAAQPRRPAYQQANLFTNPATQQRAALQVMNQLRKVPSASALERRQIARDLVGQASHVGTRLTAAGACQVLRRAGVPAPLVAFFADDKLVDDLAMRAESWGRSWVHVPTATANATGGEAPKLAAGLKVPVGRRRHRRQA